MAEKAVAKASLAGISKAGWQVVVLPILVLILLVSCTTVVEQVGTTPATIVAVTPTELSETGEDSGSLSEAGLPGPTPSSISTRMLANSTLVATLVPSLTPEPTATIAVTAGMQNEAGQWWDGEEWQAPQAVGDFVFTGSEFGLKQADGSFEPIVFPSKIITAIQEGELSLNNFDSLTVDEAVFQAYDSEGVLWRILNVVDNGERNHGAFKIVSMGTTSFESIEDIPVAEFETEIVSGLDLARVRNARIVSIEKVLFSGSFNGAPKEFESMNVTFEYKNLDGTISRITAPSYGGRLYSTDEQKFLTSASLRLLVENRLVQLTMTLPRDTSSTVNLNTTRGSIELGYFSNPDLISNPALLFVTNPPYNFGSNLDPDYPGTIFSIHVQPNP